MKPNRPGNAKPVKAAAIIDVGDDYFSPELVNIKRGDVIRWVWNDLNHDPHDVNLVSGPNGVDRGDFNTGSLPAVGFTFSRRFVVPGTYSFTCSVHFKMTMKVVVS